MENVTRQQPYLHIDCDGCGASVLFSLLETQGTVRQEEKITCTCCQKKYAFDAALVKQLKQFESLCRAIHASRDILGKSAIAVDVGSHHVKVPFNILLTRLSSVIELEINGKKQTIAFRFDPVND